MQFNWEEFMDAKSKIVIYYKSTEAKKMTISEIL